MAHRTILILEDEALIAMEMAMELETHGLVAFQALTIAEALAAIAERSFDAAILDLNIHGEQTTVVAEALRAKRVPFVVCSGSQFSELSEIFAGAPTVPKPFRSDELTSTLRQVLERAN
jgi:DNA-binding response OmpR family regulator